MLFVSHLCRIEEQGKGERERDACARTALLPSATFQLGLLLGLELDAVETKSPDPIVFCNYHRVAARALKPQTCELRKYDRGRLVFVHERQL